MLRIRIARTIRSVGCWLGGLGGAGGAPPVLDPLSLSPSLWLKADAGTFQTSGGAAAVADADPVGEWQDQSGNARHLAQATAASRGTLKLAIKNSLSVVRFDGVDDFLNVAFAINQPTTRFVVFFHRSADDGTHVISFGLSNTNYLYYVSASTLRIHSGVALDIAATNSAWHISRSTFNGASSKSSVDAGAVTTADAGTTNATSFQLGAFGLGGSPSLYSDCDIGEVLVFPSALSDANVAAVLSYLNGRWGVY